MLQISGNLLIAAALGTPATAQLEEQLPVSRDGNGVSYSFEI